MVNTESVLYYPLQDVTDALSDLRNTQSQNFNNVLMRFLSLFDAERVAMQLELCRAVVRGDIHLFQFVHDYCYPGSNRLSDHLRKFVDTILEPIARDMRRLTESRPLPPVLFEAMGRLPESGDAKLNSILKQACAKFRDPTPAARREAVEQMWDA